MSPSTAQRVHQIEPATYDPDRLLQFSLRAADGFGSISTRYQISAMGRGHRDETTLTASAAANENGTISYSGVPRYFTKRADGLYAGVGGDLGVLKLVSGHYELRDADGWRVAFRSDGKWDYSEDTSGNRLTPSYSGSRVSSIADSLGDTISFVYNASGRVIQRIDEVGLVTTYTYDVADHLLTGTDRFGTTTNKYVTGQGASREHAVKSISFHDGTSSHFELHLR